MRLIIRDTNQDASLYLAEYIVRRINTFNPSPTRPFVLGLPTGSSPELIYKYLVKFFQSGKISFRDVVTFNMDEYVGLPRDHPQSYHSFMYYHFFAHIDIRPENVHLLDGNATDLERECTNYESRIASFGGINLFLGGVGPDGHIAFNEPASSLSSRTRAQPLADSTVNANARFFDGDMLQVPRLALTVGVGTIMDAQEVALIATGAGKARAVKMGIEGGVNHLWTISALQQHPQCLMVVDEAACQELMMKTVKYFKQVEKTALDSASDRNMSIIPSSVLNLGGQGFQKAKL